MSDYDPPSAFWSRTRCARKPHRCYECNLLILPGEPYVYASGIWDGRASAFKFCCSCDTLRDELEAPADIDDGIPFGFLGSRCLDVGEEWGERWEFIKAKARERDASTAEGAGAAR